MRISDLARATGVPVATIKFYLRSGLLPEGELTSPTQARYDDSHVARLRLLRALLGPGGLSIAAARSVLAAIESPPASTHALLGVAHAAVTPAARGPADVDRAQALLHRWGWPVEDDDANQAVFAAALAGLDAADFVVPEAVLDEYARAAEQIAAAEIDGVPTDSPGAAVRYVVLGTVLLEPLLLALRRMAQQQASARRFGDRPDTHPAAEVADPGR